MKYKRHIIIRLMLQSKLLAASVSCFVLFFVISALPVSAQSPDVCQIGLTLGSDLTDEAIDGDTSSGWNDASVLQSGSPCLESLLDWNGTSISDTNNASPDISQAVHILSKRSATHLYLAFKVEDQTQNRQDTDAVGAELLLGEQLVIQIDPDNSGGSELGSSNLDYRIELKHRWGSNLETYFFDSSVDPTDSFCGQQDWDLVGSSEDASSPLPSGLIATLSTAFSGGYSVELKIPLNAISSPSSDIGLAFAVINDLGYCSGNCDATGIAFPNSLPINNASNPLLEDPSDPAACDDWLVPDTWGEGFFNEPNSNVWISHSPKYWKSEDLRAFKCDSATPDYTYYPSAPCNIEVEADLRNSGSDTQVRNLLFLWAGHGANPADWAVIDLVENVSIPPEGTTVRSAQWSPDPGLPEGKHPCVRVYILPAAFTASFDKDEIWEISDHDDLMDMLAAYDLAEKGAQSAQKNIARLDTAPNCPEEGCHVPAVPESGNTLYTAGVAPDGRLSTSLLLIFVSSITAVGLFFRLSHRTPLRQRRTRSLLSLLTVVMLIFVACGTGGGGAPTNGGQTEEQNSLLSPKEMEQFGNDHAIVQFAVFGFSEAQITDGQPTYNFIENMGGVVQLVPKDMLESIGAANLFFDITNTSDLPQIMQIHPSYAAPDDLELELRFDIAPQLFQPQQQLQFSNAILHLPGFEPVFPYEGAGLEGGIFINKDEQVVLPNGEAYQYEQFKDADFVRQLQGNGWIDQIYESPSDVPIISPVP